MRPRRINAANRKFYDSVSKPAYVARTRATGLDTYRDIEQVQEWLLSKDHVEARFWEIGACYGRVVDGLIKHTKHAAIEAWEYSPRIAAALKRRYVSNRRVRVVNRDVLTARGLRRNVDVALSLFSGLLEFSTQQQKQLLSVLAKRISIGGYLIVDLGALHIVEKKRYYTLARRGRILRFQLLTREQLKTFAAIAGFECVRCEEYFVGASQRLSVVFQRKTPVEVT